MQEKPWTLAEVNITALRHNYMEFRKQLQPHVKIAAVVKANAYGHGLEEVAEVYVKEGVDYLAVSSMAEAMALRKKNHSHPIFIMGYTPDKDLKLAVDHHITLTIFSLEQAKVLSELVGHREKVNIHIKIDTGFHRLGYDNFEKAEKEIKQINELPGIVLEGIFSHLALTDEQSDIIQFEKFLNLIKQIEKDGIFIPIKHICDSIGAIAYPEFHMEMVRVGALFYGYCSRKTSFELKPVMEFKTKVTSIKAIQKGDGVGYDYTFVANKEMLIATIACGYGDGMPRSLSNRGFVVINGKRAPIIGLICMDQSVVDITNISEVRVGTDVSIFGGEAEAVLPLLEIAKICETNRNELLTRISSRVPRIYIE